MTTNNDNVSFLIPVRHRGLIKTADRANYNAFVKKPAVR